MELILAIDLLHGLVVHGKSGDRSGYLPLTWGASPTADPLAFVRHIAPRSLYIADLDRIEGRGDNDEIVEQCTRLVACSYVDRGCRSPADLLPSGRLKNVIGTETGGPDLSVYKGGYLSIDIKNGRVVPSGDDPITTLSRVGDWAFEGCIILNISDVGTSRGLATLALDEMRNAYGGRLIYGGGVSSEGDLVLLHDAGFDGAILATAVHKGSVSIDLVRRGLFC
ncbi:MAG: nickel transporter [Methanoregulaceae archaeon]|nr:nickel transporter [Methanoregulaceae archaeon]